MQILWAGQELCAAKGRLTVFAFKNNKLDELQYCSSPLPAVCCLLCHFIVWARHVKSTLGLRPGSVRAEGLCPVGCMLCVVSATRSRTDSTCPANQRVTLRLWTATFLCASLCELVRLCAYVFSFVGAFFFLSARPHTRGGKKNGRVFVMMAVSWPDGRWGASSICFHKLRQERRDGYRQSFILISDCQWNMRWHLNEWRALLPTGWLLYCIYSSSKWRTSKWRHSVVAYSHYKAVNTSKVAIIIIFTWTPEGNFWLFSWVIKLWYSIKVDSGPSRLGVLPWVSRVMDITNYPHGPCYH